MEANDRVQTFSFTRMIDVSVGLVPDAVHSP